jgi:hypothetical protein
METIITDVIIQGPATCGRTGETYYEAWLPLRSPAHEYIKGTPVGSGATPYAAMRRLASKYPWSKEGGPLVSLSFVGPVADKVILDYHTCPDCGKDEREDERHGGHYFVCEATEEGRAGRAMWAEEAAKKRLADAAPDLLHALKWAAEYVSLYTADGAGWTGVQQGHDRDRFITDNGDFPPEHLRAFIAETITKATTEEG